MVKGWVISSQRLPRRYRVPVLIAAPRSGYLFFVQNSFLSTGDAEIRNSIPPMLY